MLSLVSAGGTGGFLSLRAGEVLSQVLAAHGSVHRSLLRMILALPPLLRHGDPLAHGRGNGRMRRAIKSAQHLRRGPLCRARLFILDEINLFVLGANRFGRAHNDRCRGLLHLARSVKRVQRHLLDYLQIDY